MKEKNNKLKYLRFGTQLLFVLVIAAFAINNIFAEKGNAVLPSASTHALCPMGGVETFFTFITTGDFISKIHSSSLILMIIVFVITVLFGALFCGFICPFGTIQEWIGKIGKKLFPKKIQQIYSRKGRQSTSLCSLLSTY